MNKHAEGNLGIGSGEMELGGVKWDASAPLVLTPHPAFQLPEPKITVHPGDPMKEVMRIDRHGVKVNPEYTVDEATQHVLNALSAHIQHTVNRAVAQEREACAKVCEDNEVVIHLKGGGKSLQPRFKDAGSVCDGDAYAAAIRARGNT